LKGVHVYIVCCTTRVDRIERIMENVEWLIKHFTQKKPFREIETVCFLFNFYFKFFGS
jgi:diaminopimelate decarboxylase